MPILRRVKPNRVRILLASGPTGTSMRAAADLAIVITTWKPSTWHGVRPLPDPIPGPVRGPRPTRTPLSTAVGLPCPSTPAVRVLAVPGAYHAGSVTPSQYARPGFVAPTSRVGRSKIAGAPASLATDWDPRSRLGGRRPAAHLRTPGAPTRQFGPTNLYERAGIAGSVPAWFDQLDDVRELRRWRHFPDRPDTSGMTAGPTG